MNFKHTNKKNIININDTLFDFKLLKKEYNQEIKAEVFKFSHIKTGASLFAIKNNDPNKTFMVSFRTLPESSNGVAHVLEHTVLSGSRKFKLKDVFNEINKGGLTTFLNAMTGPDTTYYPFATRNEKEYFNIMDIYMDTIFHPQLQEFAFMQEGWRYHLEKPENEIELKGIVYNEMKGVYSNPTNHAWYTLFEHIMPNSTYSHVSGGNPKNIPDLTWEELKFFHQKFYHPTNSVFFLYGNAPIKKELEFLHKNYLAEFKKQKITEKINFGNNVVSFKKIESTYAVNKNDPIDDKTFLVLGIPVSTVDNEEEILALKILGEILFSSEASPFKLEFNKYNIGKDIEGGLLDQNHQAIMFIEVIGSESKKINEFINLFRSSMNQLIITGLDNDLKLSELNSFEFNNREESCNSQRGLNYGLKIIKANKLKQDSFKKLKFDKLFFSIRNKILNENYLEKLIQEKLLNLNHSVCVILKPEREKNDREVKELNKKLSIIKKNLTTKQKTKLIQKTTEFKNYQNKVNSESELATLPIINKTDIPKKIELTSPHITNEKNNFTTIINELYTNGIIYYNFGFDCKTLPKRLLPYLDIFGTILTEIGTKDINYIDFAKKINIFSGGFNHQFSVYNSQNNRDSIKPIFWLNIKILREYINEGLNILNDVIFNFDFSNQKRIKEILQRNFAWMENNVQSEGFHIPLHRTKASINKSSIYTELVSGSTSYLTIKKILNNYKEYESELINAIQEIGCLLFNKNNALISITGEEKDILASQKIITKIVEKLNVQIYPIQNNDNNSKYQNDGFITSSEIVFAVQTGDIFNAGIKYKGSFEVLKTYLGNVFLHDNIRAKGGAYGCFPILDSITGLFSFVSYRDPNVSSTFKTFNQIANAINNMNLSERSLEQLIIKTYGNFDPLLNPYMQGIRARNRFLTNSSNDLLHNTLSEIKSTTINQLQNYSNLLYNFTQNSVRGIIGNRKKIEQNKHLFDNIIHL